MATLAHNRSTLLFLVLLAGFVFSVANILVLLITVKGSITVPLATELYRICAPCVVYFAVAPMVVAFLHVLLLRQAWRSDAGPVQLETAREVDTGKSQDVPVPAGGHDPADGALQLLALLQREGRFLDFLAEDLNAYSDAQIGAAVRAIHAGCRKALEGRLELERILPGEEGQEVTVPASFDAEEIRLVGEVHGSPPYRGLLQHSGWRAKRFELPKTVVGTRRQILAPAEVEIPESQATSRA